MYRIIDGEMQFPNTYERPDLFDARLKRRKEEEKRRITPVDHPDRLSNRAISLSVASKVTIPSQYLINFSEFGLDGLLTGLEYIARTEAMMAPYSVLKPYGQDERQDDAVDSGFANLSVIKTQCERSQIDIADYRDAVRRVYNGGPQAWKEFFSSDMTTPAFSMPHKTV